MTNPFRPGNGIEPKYLAGREDIINSFETSLRSYEEGLSRNVTISGLRGTGKTVLLRYFKVVSESRKWVTVEREFNERFQDESEFAEAFVQDLISKATEVSLLKRVKETGKKVADILKPQELQIYGVTYKPFYKTRKQPSKII
jgi:predicted AAA+ superfamily ATPase